MSGILFKNCVWFFNSFSFTLCVVSIKLKVFQLSHSNKQFVKFKIIALEKKINKWSH